MDRDPDRRYQTAGELAEDLRRFVNRFAISARRVGPMGRTVKWVRRHPSLSVCLAVIVLASGVAVALALELSQRDAEAKLTLAKERAFLAALAGNFEQAEEHIKQAELLDASTGWARLLNGQIKLNRGDYDEALADLEQAEDLLDESTAAYALLTEAYGQSGDEGTCRMRVAELRLRKAVTFEDFLFKGMALSAFFPAEAVKHLDEAYKLNPTSLVVLLLRSRARRLYALDRADAEYASLAMRDAATAKGVSPSNPIAVAEFIQASIVAANIADEQGRASDALRFLAQAGVDGIEGKLLSHSDVRLARLQYFLRTADDEKAMTEILREPLGRKS